MADSASPPTPNINPAAAVPAMAATPANNAASFNDFSSKKLVEGSTEFLESNSWIAKIAFLLMVIIGFVILFRLMVALVTWIFTPSGKVVLVNGLQNGSHSTIISQDPNLQNSATILRSNNEKDGIEFTWSVWLYLNGFEGDSSSTKYHHVFNKGNATDSGNGIIKPNNAPGLYLNPMYNGFRVIMNLFSDPNEDTIDVTDLPMTKWMNIMIRVQHKNCDIYVNGRLVKRRVMTDVVKQNYDNVNVCLHGGFSGYLSNLTYYNNAIGIAEIQNVISAGPNLTPISKSINLNEIRPRYLSDKWYFDQTMGNN
jgi:hypothetical protein